MLQTRTAIEYREGAAAVVPAMAGAGRIAEHAGERDARLAGERALDEALADSFPASDPPSSNAGITRLRPAEGSAMAAAPVRDDRERRHRAGVIDVSLAAGEERTLLRALVSLFGAVGLALLFGIAVIVIGLPIALVIRAVLEAVGWLFGVNVR